ncbi:hypothetical protein V500_07539 [Pseudogymnoascus sp. VKM F-4518 (FW-2643)]|nr:hypothetical protein V500_07539 [Pseudogymnoascus sp. VKM F-4518 (FW-2643)]
MSKYDTSFHLSFRGMLLVVCKPFHFIDYIECQSSFSDSSTHREIKGNFHRVAASMASHEYIFKEVGDARIAADVHYVKGNTGAKHPIALYFHGGNFTVGSKELLSKNYIERLLELGFVVISANYRLCPTTTVYDGPVSDTLDAYRWAQNTLPGLLKRDSGIDVDGTEIVVLGHSCGGTLALLTAGLPNPPLAILDLYGMKYLQDPFYSTPSVAMSKIPEFDKDFINQIYKDIPPPTSGLPPMGPQGPDFSNYRIAWMFNAIKEGKHMQTVIADGNSDRVDPATLFSERKFPPTYFVHGTADTLVHPKFSQHAYDELKAKGMETELVLVEGAGHGFDAKAKPGDDFFTIVNKGFEFLKAHIGT